MDHLVANHFIFKTILDLLKCRQKAIDSEYVSKYLEKK